MAVRLYNEYIKVDPNFIPVLSRNSDRIYPDKWQSFYPHTSFKNILKDTCSWYQSWLHVRSKGDNRKDSCLQAGG